MTPTNSHRKTDLRIVISMPSGVTTAAANGQLRVTVPMGAGKEAPPITRQTTSAFVATRRG
jgi:hypothetical protein